MKYAIIHLIMTVTKSLITNSSRRIICFSLLTVMMVLSTTKLAQAFSSADLFYPKAGLVMGKTAVIDPDSGEPILMVVNRQGEEVEELGPRVDPLDTMTIWNADGYRSDAQAYQALLDNLPETITQGHCIIAIENYGSEHCGDSSVTVASTTPDGEPQQIPIRYPTVYSGAPGVSIENIPNAKYVVLRNSATIVDPRVLGQDGPVLFVSRIDLNAINSSVVNDPAIRSLLLTEEGRVHYATQHNITYRDGFYKPTSEYDESNSSRFLSEDRERVMAPIVGAKVYSTNDVTGRFGSYTDQDGFYYTNYWLTPCPCFSFDHSAHLVAEIPFRNYNPLNSESLPFATWPVFAPTFDFCSGYHYCPLNSGLSLVAAAVEQELFSIHSSTAHLNANNLRHDIPVDSLFLTGLGMVTDKRGQQLPLGETRYSTEQQGSFTDEDPASLNFDFDLDRQSDQAVLHEGEYYIYLGGREIENDDEGNPINEDFRRRPDQLNDYQDRGMLESISTDDLEETDIYVYRVSTGELIIERENLKTEEFDSFNGGASNEDNHFFYNQLIQGPRQFRLSGTSYSDWWSDAGINIEMFNNRYADFLQMGEEIQIIAINRPTGYIANTIATLQYNQQFGGTTLDVPIGALRLRPPNLRVRAERRTETELGLTQGEINDYLISSEGAGLTSDQYIVIKTEWFDHDGRPLPSDLPGYSATLAKIVGNEQLANDSACTSSASPIEIQPGSRIQLLKLGDNCDLGTEHYYLYVCGHHESDSARDKCFSFNNTNDIGRPNYYVPVQVPFYDEVASRAQYKSYRYGKEDGIIAEDAEPPEPLYRWYYRPEMQFSVYELAVEELRVAREQEDGTQDILDILNKDIPIIGGDVDYTELLFGLLNNENDPLPTFGPEQELIFAFGEHEVLTTVGEDQSLQFENIEHLSSLLPEDFLSLRLYANNDASNILWEWSFLSMEIRIVEDEKAIIGEEVAYVSADDSSVELSALLIGYTSLDDSALSTYPRNIRWEVLEGNASLSPVTSSIGESGAATTTLTLTPHVDNIVKVRAIVVGDETSYIDSHEIGVVAGNPASITVSQSGTTYLKGKGNVDVTADVRDQYGNRVTNGTGVEFRENGHINVVSYSGLTDQGEATAKVTGGSVAGSSILEVRSGSAMATTNITVNPLTVSFSGLPSNVLMGEKYSITATVSGGTGSLEGIFLDIGADAGKIIADELVTDSNGQLQFTYESPEFTGTFNLAAKLDLEQPYLQPFTISPPSGPGSGNDFRSEKYYLVSNSGALQGSTVTNFRGENSTLSFNSTNSLTLSGAPGAPWQVSADDIHLVNREPLYFSRFNNFRWDQTKSYESTFENISRRKSNEEGIFSLSFGSTDPDQRSYWSLQKYENLEVQQPSFNFWLDIQEPGRILDVASGSIVLEYSNGQLSAMLETTTGTQTLSISDMNTSTTYAVSIGVRNGNFYLSANDQIQQVTLNGAMINYSVITEEDSSPWLVLGDGFEGQISGLRIYDWSSEPLISLTSSSGVFDSNGLANVELQLSSQYQPNSVKIPGVSVAILDQQGRSTEVNVLSGDVVASLARYYSDVYSQSNLDVDNLLTRQILLDELFPDAKRSASRISRRFSLQSLSESAQSNVIANIGWLGFEDRYPVLHDKIVPLQTFFADGGYTNLSIYAVEYLQEAVVQAGEGELFWLRAMSTGLTVWGELLDVRPDLAGNIAASIKNRTDFWSWIRILSLPADGWVTDSIPIPRPDMTCDRVTPDANIGTLMEFSTTPCRATGVQMAAVLDYIISIDPAITTSPEILTIYFTTIMASLRESPYEFRKLFPPMSSQLSLQSGFIPEAQAPVWFYVIRGLAVAVRQAIRKGGAAAPVNFVAFMQGGTTSRVTPVEMLASVAYLVSRIEDVGQCTPGENCLNAQVAETVLSDIAVWFAGVGLSKNGEITDEPDKRKSCTVSGNAHGKAFETVLTAMYHALYEFGARVGVPNPQQYQILLSDPKSSNNKIEVPVMFQKSNGEYEKYDNSPHHRKPDLVLYGEGEGQRTWVEAKSWMFKPKYFNSTTNTLDPTIFSPWNGYSKTGSNNFRTNAHRQFFLDYTATLDNLNSAYWEEKGLFLSSVKPGEHVTWLQVWNYDVRSYKELERDSDGRGYQLAKKLKTIRPAEPWIETGGAITQVPVKFRQLQKYLSSAPMGIKREAFETTVGYPLGEHGRQYQNSQISNSVASLHNSTIQPFTVVNFLAREVGTNGVKDLWKDVLQEFAGERFAELKSAIATGEISEEQMNQLREELTEEMVEILGPWRHLTVRIPILSHIEDAAADAILGDEVDALRKAAAEFELPESLFENVCEI